MKTQFLNLFQKTWAAFVGVFSTLALTAVVMNVGGPHNPITVLYLVIAGFAAMSVSWQTLIAIDSLVLIALTYIYTDGFGSGNYLEILSPDFSAHLRGMWLANSFSVLLISVWIAVLRQRQRVVQDQRHEALRLVAQLEKVDSVGRLAAEALHQINTPLGTIQLGLSELKDENLQLSERQLWFEDMQDGVLRISKILNDLKNEYLPISSVGHEQQINLQDYLTLVAERWARPRQIPLKVQMLSQGVSVRNLADADEISRCLIVLLDNARESGREPNSSVELFFSETENDFSFSVRDYGRGFLPDVLNKAGTPLFTTKPFGTGLGLYSCQKILEKHHGNVVLANETPGAKVTVRMSFQA